MHKTLAGGKKRGGRKEICSIAMMRHFRELHACISTLPSESSESVVRSKYPQKKVPESVEVIRLHGTGLEDPDDGFAWKKYGSKEILGSKYPRSYYRCIYRHTRGCLATKLVQRSEDDPSTFEVTYRGRHSCGRHLESSYQKTSVELKEEEILLTKERKQLKEITRIFRTVYMLVKVIRAMTTNRGNYFKASEPRSRHSHKELDKKLGETSISKLEELSDRLTWFCSLLPSNYEFDKDTMIQLVVAQGFFNHECAPSMETMANQQFDDMFKKRFILESRFDMARGRMKYKVDNVVSTSPYLRVQEAELSNTSEEVQHLSLLSEYVDQATYKILQGFNKLQTLILFCQNGDSIKRVPYDLFLKLQHLRTLDLHGTNISELPDSISYLSSLYYLDVSETPLRLLPESIGSLRHLQTL
ncbi:uncharacterized protein LOC132614913 isoform X2 [Lycium barbarum]|uniref:uncharacterized protein LOC132614913 isoform X2 n=1 Tax=Lycium barbarum TaxID=112863 RepID=UPI00293EDDDF|nr:uncharacterized protein LOC132614913 isoform X2 [Lycium barbarum]